MFAPLALAIVSMIARMSLSVKTNSTTGGRVTTRTPLWRSSTMQPVFSAAISSAIFQWMSCS